MHRLISLEKSICGILKTRRSRLYSSTSLGFQPIRILWASQGGTAKLFGLELRQVLEENLSPGFLPAEEIAVHGWHEFPPEELLSEDAINILLTSVTGVGEPPDNGRAFFEYLTNQSNSSPKSNSFISDRIRYSVFGLGNSKAHPNHFNTVGKLVDEKLASMGATRVHPLGLGDDGDCIEDDFDVWTESFLRTLKNNGLSDAKVESSKEATTLVENSGKSIEGVQDTAGTVLPSSEEISRNRIPCAAARDADGLRRAPMKYPQLDLRPSIRAISHHDLFHLSATDQRFYADATIKAGVVNSHVLSSHGGAAGLREIVLDIQDQRYETGDHCLVYPRNDSVVVEAYLQHLDVDPNAVIETSDRDYPYPTGLTVYETLSHCVDLGAPPSPSFARKLLNRSQLDFKQEIVAPRTTVLSLLIQGGTQVALEDVLYQATPMKPRYYSIASSPLENPSQLRLTFRPVKYVTTQGHIRDGVCTSYMSLMREAVDQEASQSMAITLLPNPTFRLPSDPQTPVLLIAGGCGVAPIRAFCQERILMREKYQVNLGPGTLFLGFRSPEDQVYKGLIQKALAVGALTDVKVAYSTGWTEPAEGIGGYCGHVDGLVRSEADLVWTHIRAGGSTYLCGGARTFGAAVERELLEILQELGRLDFEEATTYLRQLIDDGMLLEDLAD